MIIKYNVSLDRYERFNPNNGMITDTVQGWDKGVYFYNNMFRKEEKDWKMVYVCRRG